MRAVGYIRPDAARAGGPATAAGDAGQDEFRVQFDHYCRDRGHQLVAVIAPRAAGEGAPLSDDQQFAVLARRCVDESQRPGVVLMPDSPHLADDLDAYVERVLWLEGLGIEVRCTSSPLADALENGLKLLRPARRTAERVSRIREAIASKASRGEVLGRTPYGYRVGLDGQLEPVEAEAAVVREIFDLYTGGPHGGQEQLGLRRISARLNTRGSRTRGGRLWTTVSLAGVLRNPAYTGYYKRRSVRIPENHAPIVDRAVFERAQRAMLDRKPRRRERTRDEYLLAGLVHCEKCGRTLHGLLRERKWRTKGGAERQRSYRYYECPARPQDRGTPGAHASWRCEVLERAILERIGAIVSAGGPEAGRRLVLSGGPSAADAVDEAVRRVRTAIGRIAAGTGQIAEFTMARAQLRRARAAESKETTLELSVPEALDAARSADRALARRAVRALVEGASAGVASVHVRLRGDGQAAA